MLRSDHPTLTFTRSKATSQIDLKTNFPRPKENVNVNVNVNVKCECENVNSYFPMSNMNILLIREILFPTVFTLYFEFTTLQH